MTDHAFACDFDDVLTVSRRNESGMPLASSDWLEVHHLAKLAERRAHVSKLVELGPARVVDLGCGSGLWLELFNDLLPDECEIIGLDADEKAIEEARRRANEWTREASFEVLDIAWCEDVQIPCADLYLAFNIFGYLPNLPRTLEMLAARRLNAGRVAIRQYDGASIRFGPMPPDLRQQIDASLWASLGSSEQFRHYDLDRSLQAIVGSPFEYCLTSFESFSRFGPFEVDFVSYWDAWLDWVRDRLSERVRVPFDQWRPSSFDLRTGGAFYALEPELVALLS